MATNNLDELLTKIEKISEIEKCQTCQCSHDTLLEFKELLNKGKTNEEMKQKLLILIHNAEITHNCLGCEPCLPVPVSDALSEITGIPASKTCRPVCKPLMSIKKPSQLYPEQKKSLVEAQKPQKLILDPSGFFIIYPKKEEGNIYLEHYFNDGTLNKTIYGDDPVSIASTAIERSLVSQLDHAAYLGRELEKAFLSMSYGFPYTGQC